MSIFDIWSTTNFEMPIETGNRHQPRFQNRAPMENRIKELRQARNWSMQKLAEALGTTAPTVNKLEKGQTALNVHWMARLAKVFEISPADLLIATKDEETFFSDDAQKYEYEGAPPQNIKLDDTEFLYQVTTDVLDQIGITKGMLLRIGMSPEVLSHLNSDDVVIAQLYHGNTAVTLLRQFIAPSLLITNTIGQNAPILNLRIDDVVIKGVVTAAYNFFGSKRPSA